MQALGFKINISSSCRGRQHKTCRRILSSCYFPVTRRQQGRKKGISLSSLSGLQMHSATYLPPFVHIVFGLAGACFIILPQTCSQSNAATPLVCRRCRSTEHTTVDALSCHFFPVLHGVVCFCIRWHIAFPSMMAQVQHWHGCRSQMQSIWSAFPPPSPGVAGMPPEALLSPVWLDRAEIPTL